MNVCPFCPECVEDECHVILICKHYNDLREPLIKAAIDYDPSLSTRKLDLLHFILSHKDFYQISAKTMYAILRRRFETIYST